MTGARLALVLSALATTACTLDLVDVADDSDPVSRLSVLIRAGEWPSEPLNVHAVLTPGWRAGGAQREVTDPAFGVLGVALRPDTTLERTGMAITWREAVSPAAPTPLLISMGFPSVAGSPTPPAPVVGVRRPAGVLDPSGAWAPGRDLGLRLSPAGGMGTPAVESSWELGAVAWTGERGALLSTAFFRSALPDSIILPALLLAAEGGDSLEITVRYERGYESKGAGLDFAFVGHVTQVLRWVVPIVDP